MSLKIEITAHPEVGPLDHQIEQAMEALGFSRTVAPRTVGKAPELGMTYGDAAREPETDDAAEEQAQVEAFHEAADAPPARKRGEPSPGRKRRTREEIAEDEAADRADRVVAGMHSGLARDELASDLAPQISTGESRVGPEDDPETAAQDAADEAAEVEANRDPENPLTLDDVRKAVGEYTRLYGMKAAAEDVPALLGRKMTELPEDQASLQSAIATMRQAINDNPFGRAAGAAPSPAASAKREKADPTPRAATLEEVMAALGAYVKAFGQEAFNADRKAIFEKAIGPVPAGTTNDKGAVVDYWPLSALPKDAAALGKVVTYWEAALTENPFKRASVS